MNITICVRQALREDRIPFEITLYPPKAETTTALLEAEALARASNLKRYNDVEEALKELKI